MGTAICPRCGTVNPINAMNCRQCRINLEFARANPEVAQGLTRDLKTANVVAEFLPSKSRYFSRVILFSAIGGLIAVILVYLTFGVLAVPAVLAVITLNVLKEYFTYNRYKIVITDDAIAGPSAAGRNMITIPHRQIDKKRSGKAKLLSKLEGDWQIYSAHGDRLILSSMDFDQKQISTILSKIGFAGKN